MADDVKRLAERAGWTEADYREIAAQEEERAALASWPLLASVMRSLEALRGRAADGGVTAGSPPRASSRAGSAKWP